MSEDKSAIKAVAETVEQAQNKIEGNSSVKKDKFVTLSSGVKFKIKEVPQFAYVDLRNSYPEPMPPVYYNEELDREEPNPQDPRYKAAYSNWSSSISGAITDLNIALGTEAVHIPKNVNSPESEEFIDKLTIILSTFGWTKREIKAIGKTTRYLYWVKYEAASSGFVNKGDDLDVLISEVNRASGVPEEDVTEEISGFQSDD